MDTATITTETEVQFSWIETPSSDTMVKRTLDAWVEEDLQLWLGGICPTIRFLTWGDEGVRLGTTSFQTMPFDLESPSNLHTLLVVFRTIVKKHGAFAGALSLALRGVGSSADPLYMRFYFSVPLEVLADPNHPHRADNLELVNHYFAVHADGLSVTRRPVDLAPQTKMSLMLPLPSH